jgi:hypothetical protein
MRAARDWQASGLIGAIMNAIQRVNTRDPGRSEKSIGPTHSIGRRRVGRR